MANTNQVKKRVRQSIKRYQHNVALRSKYKTCIKNVVIAIRSKDKNKAEVALKAAIPIIDRIASRGMIHKNKAARHKSRLTSHIKQLV